MVTCKAAPEHRQAVLSVEVETRPLLEDRNLAPAQALGSTVKLLTG